MKTLLNQNGVGLEAPDEDGPTSLFLSVLELEVEQLEISWEQLRSLGYVQLFTRRGPDVLNAIARHVEEWL